MDKNAPCLTMSGESSSGDEATILKSFFRPRLSLVDAVTVSVSSGCLLTSPMMLLAVQRINTMWQICKAESSGSLCWWWCKTTSASHPLSHSLEWVLLHQKSVQPAKNQFAYPRPELVREPHCCVILYLSTVYIYATFRYNNNGRLCLSATVAPWKIKMVLRWFASWRNLELAPVPVKGKGATERRRYQDIQGGDVSASTVTNNRTTCPTSPLLLRMEGELWIISPTFWRVPSALAFTTEEDLRHTDRNRWMGRETRQVLV